MLTTEEKKAPSSMNDKSIDLSPSLSAGKLSSGKAPLPFLAKLSIFLGFILSLVALGGAAYIYQNLQSERNERSALEASRIQLQDQVDSLQQENGRMESQVSRLREQLKSYSVENAKIKKELDQRYIEFSNLKKQLREYEESALAAVQTAAYGPDGQIINPFEAEAAAPALEVVTETASDMVMEAEPSDAAVTLPAASSLPTQMVLETPVAPVVSVAPSTMSAPSPTAVESAAAPELNAQIMTVNRKFNFVVINIGLKDGLKMGDRLEVLREGTSIAGLQVEKLYDRFAAATILNESKKFKLEKGDKVNYV